MNNLDIIHKINKNLIQEDGSIDNFQTQIIDLLSGNFDVTKPMIIDDNSKCMDYVLKIDKSYPMVMMVSTFIKLQNKHQLTLRMIQRVEKIIKESSLCFESLTEDESVVFLTEELHSLSGDPFIVTCRFEKKAGVVSVNEITSMYDKRSIENFISSTFNSEKTFYKRKKIEHTSILNRLQLPQELTYALSNNYDKCAFRKSQVVNDYRLAQNIDEQTEEVEMEM